MVDVQCRCSVPLSGSCLRKECREPSFVGTVGGLKIGRSLRVEDLDTLLRKDGKFGGQTPTVTIPPGSFDSVEI